MDLSPPPRYRRHLDRYTVGQWFGVATAGLAVLAAIAVIGGVVAISNLADARERVVDAVDPASRAGQDVLAAYLNQETGVRGFAQTGVESFLAPYELGRRQLADAAAELRRYVKPLRTRELDADVTAVLEAGRAWEDGFVTPTLARVRADGPITDAAQAGSGKARFNALRSRVAHLQTTLTEERAQAKDDLSQAADRLTITFVLVGLLLVVGGGSILFVLRSAVSTPVARLAFRTRRVAQGEFERVVVPEGPRDIYELGEDVETMRERIVHELTIVEEARRVQETHQAELERQQHELERSNAELEQFAYVASHDLQEPLRKVASFTQLLQKRYGGQLDARADQYIDFAVDGATRMQQLINDLLAFSRVGRLSADEATVFSTDEALERALGSLAEAVAESGAVVEHEPLPSVRGEANLVAAVFQNLIGNAIKFRAPDVVPRIDVGVRRAGAMWEFVVADNGIGVDAEYADRIFMIFQRLHPKDVYPGTGIGLAMCRKIIEYHGGRIWLDQDVASGSAFHFTLPALPGD